jgi:hypothetical protein
VVAGFDLARNSRGVRRLANGFGDYVTDIFARRAVQRNLLAFLMPQCENTQEKRKFIFV